MPKISSSFDNCVSLIIALEGGYVYDRFDPGGETNFGISKRAHPDINIKKLTVDKARAIYEIKYWQVIRAGLLPEGFNLIYFDCAVNQGKDFAIKTCQSLYGVTPDGIIGPETIHAYKIKRPENFVLNFAEKRMLRYASNANFSRYKNGWIDRLFSILKGIKNYG